MQTNASHADADVARAARDAARGRRAWVFSSAAAHARLELTGCDGGEGGVVPVEAEGLALRTAGVAINAELPVAVLGEARGPLADAAFLGVPVPFVDGRMGALVVVGDHAMIAARDAADALEALAAAEVRTAGRLGARWRA